MKNNDLAAYTQRFQELTMLCTKMVPKEEDQVEKFIGGLPDNIQGNVIATEPTRLQHAVRMANNLMDQKLKGYAMKNAKNKRKFDNSQKDNYRQQPPFKRHNVRGHNVARAYTAGNNERRVYNGPLPLCNKCKFHHEGPCTMRCGKCNKCGKQGHYRSDCPKLKDQNRGSKTRNKSGIGEARGKAYMLGEGDVNPDSNVVTGTFRLNNHYASVLFDSGVDRSFMSTTFSTLLDIIPDTLEISYAVELADGRVSETNIVLRGCTLGLLGHQFNIDLMQVELGTFDVIIDMDWLANHHAVIVCDDKIVRIPYGDEVLIVQGDRNGKRKKSKLSIISCNKTQKYIKKGFLILLAQIMKKETEDKSEDKRLEEVPTIQDFPKDFLEDLLGLPPTRQVEFQIDLVPSAAPVARAPYRLAPSELQELSTQLQELSDKGFIRPNSSPWGAPILFVKKKDGSFFRNGKGRKSKLRIISCTKTRKYIKKGCLIFLAQVMKKETEDKSEDKRLEDVPTVRDFPEVFPEDFPGLPPTQQVEFQIDLVPCVAPVARAPYRLAPSELQELSTQLQELSDKGFIRPSPRPREPQSCL
ncbi:putative reverse transcriptase domain-containing protein [Tanacetum coccineum]